MKRHCNSTGTQAIILTLLVGVMLMWGCSGNDGAAGPPGPAGPAGSAGPAATSTDESCTVCHSTGKVADIAVAHPDPSGLEVNLSITNLANTGGVAVVSFNATTADGPVTDLVIGDFQFMIADLVPAGTITNWGTWDSDYFERWARERVSDGNVGAFDTTGAAAGNYTYTFTTGFGSVAAIIEAPDYDPTHTQRLYIVLSGGDHIVNGGSTVVNNTVGFFDFVVPAVGANATELDSQRQFVTAEACKQCHGEPFQQAAHAGRYLDTRACVICHSPLGHYGSEMQDDGAYLSVLAHQIHAAIQGPRFDFTEVTYPQDIRDCVTCHTDSGLNLGTGDQIDNWKEHPTAEVCGSCHVNVNFATGENHGGGVQENGFCFVCHPADGNGFGQSVTDAHDTTPTGMNVPEFDVDLTITDPINGSYYTAGETPSVTVTLTYHGTGIAVDPAIYTTRRDDAGVSGGGLSVASLYVYGPRAKSVPVLATDTVTDPAFDAETDTPTQGHDLFVGGNDPLVTTDSSGFGYQLLEIPDDMEAGTYLVRFEGGDYDAVSDTDYVTHSTAVKAFQVGTATVEAKVSGDSCTNCHGETRMHLEGAHPHNAAFDTDECLGCHDQSGNFAIPIANRVHAVHSANPEGDIYVIRGGSPSSRDWSDVTFPQNIFTDPRCVACHTSGDETYKTLPYTMPCAGCHVGLPGVLDHTRQNGGPY